MIGSQDARRAGHYRQLAALEEAGIPLRTAVDRVSEPEFLAVGAALDRGLAPGEAWGEAARFSPLEVTLVRAGAKSGQLVESFKSLAQVFEDTANAKRALLAGLAYPVILIHLAFIILDLRLLVVSGLGAYLHGFLPLAYGYVAVAALVFVLRAFNRSSPAAAGSLLQAIPLLGGLVKRRALVHGVRTLVAVYRAGVPITEAVESAASVATLYSVREGFLRIRRRLDTGATIGDAFQEETTFPKELRECAATGSITGKLDEQLTGAARRLESEANTQKALLLTIVPIATYLLVALAIGYMIISFWTDYFAQINSALGG